MTYGLAIYDRDGREMEFSEGWHLHLETARLEKGGRFIQLPASLVHGDLSPEQFDEIQRQREEIETAL